jgi:hypothetical protein
MLSCSTLIESSIEAKNPIVILYPNNAVLQLCHNHHGIDLAITDGKPWKEDEEEKNCDDNDCCGIDEDSDEESDVEDDYDRGDEHNDNANRKTFFGDIVEDDV